MKEGRESKKSKRFNPSNQQKKFVTWSAKLLDWNELFFQKDALNLEQISKDLQMTGFFCDVLRFASSLNNIKATIYVCGIYIELNLFVFTASLGYNFW